MVTEISVVWVLWGIFLYGGIFIGERDYAKLTHLEHRSPKWARMISSFLLVVIAILHLIRLVFFNDYPKLTTDVQIIFAVCVAIGMFFGFIGDLFMAQLLVKTENYILFGIGAFGIGHIAYIIGGVQVLNHANIALSDTLPIIIGALVLTTVFWYALLIFRNTQTTLIHYIALPYSWLLSTTVAIYLSCLVTIGNYYNPQAFQLATLGAASFLISDLILSLQLLRGAYVRYIGDIVWFFYGTGQMLIVVSSLIAPLSLQ